MKRCIFHNWDYWNTWFGLDELFRGIKRVCRKCGKTQYAEYENTK